MTGALDGIRVLDLSRILAGPICTQLLGDYGAEIIKVERPGAGDDTRKWGPPYIADADGNDTTESAFYLSANRNKRSVAIDIATDAGQALIRRLLPKCDVLIENFRVGALARYGLGYEDLRAEFPALVYCSVTGFGQTGPYAARPGYDFLAQAMGGIMALTGEAGGPPLKIGIGIADIMTGMHAATAILAALRHVERSREGQWIDLSLLDTQISWLYYHAVEYLNLGSTPPRIGNAHASVVPYGAFETADDHVAVTIGNDSQFVDFCAFAGCDALAADQRFATNPARTRNREALLALLGPVFRGRSTAEWVAGLEAAGVPCGPINNLAEVFADPHVAARGDVVEMDDPATRGGVLKTPATPARMSATPASYRNAPPMLGAHTDSVLRDLLAMDDDEIAALRDSGVI
jgi:glutaryl-CoA transferase